MIQAKIIRQDATPDKGTKGTFLVDGKLQCFTLEPYHRMNRVNVSSIPAGQYYCKPYSSGKYPDTWEVTGVDGRSKILFHTGNTDEDSSGCIILGSEVDDNGVLESRKAFERIKKIIPAHKTFRLTIKECY
jgi:hypothetical protein